MFCPKKTIILRNSYEAILETPIRVSHWDVAYSPYKLGAPFPTMD